MTSRHWCPKFHGLSVHFDCTKANNAKKKHQCDVCKEWFTMEELMNFRNGVIK